MQSKLSIIIGLVQKMSALGEKHQKVLQALLRRVCMHGYVPLNTLIPFFDALHNQESNVKASKALYYLIALVLGPGSAGGCLLCSELHHSTFSVGKRDNFLMQARLFRCSQPLEPRSPHWQWQTFHSMSTQRRGRSSVTKLPFLAQ